MSLLGLIFISAQKDRSSATIKRNLTHESLHLLEGELSYDEDWFEEAMVDYLTMVLLGEFNELDSYGYVLGITLISQLIDKHGFEKIYHIFNASNPTEEFKTLFEENIDQILKIIKMILSKDNRVINYAHFVYQSQNIWEELLANVDSTAYLTALEKEIAEVAKGKTDYIRDGISEARKKEVVHKAWSIPDLEKQVGKVRGQWEAIVQQNQEIRRYVSSVHDLKSLFNKGGIDLTPAAMDVQDSGVGFRYNPAVNFPRIDESQLDGFTPDVFRIIPITDLPKLLGMKK